MLTTKGPGILAAGVLALVLGAAWPAAAQTIRVGSFKKSTTVAPPGTVTQVVPHGLGITPKALILWTNRSAGGFLYAFGMTDGTTSRSVAMASQHGVDFSNSSRGMAGKALSIVQWGEVVVAEANLTAWSATNFTLTWTKNDATADTIHYIAIGGSGVSAKVVDWLMPNAAGDVSVATVGFKPDVVLHAHAGYDYTGVLTTQFGAWFGLGVMAPRLDPAPYQWAYEVGSVDNVTTSDTQRGRVTNACIYAFDGTQTVQASAAFKSMDANGFTVTFTGASTAQSAVVSLALKGVSAQVGSFEKSLAPAFVTGQTAYVDAPAGNTATITLPAGSTDGDVMVVSFDVPSQALTVLSVMDNKGNTYSPAIAPTNWNGAANRMYTYYASNIIGGGANIVITITLSGATSTAWKAYAVEYSGLARYPVDQTSAGTGTGIAWSSGAKTTTTPDQVVYGFCMSTATGSSPNAPLAKRNTDTSGNFVSDRTVTATGSYAVTGTWTAGGQVWGCQMVTFKGGQSFLIPATDHSMGFTPGAVLLTSVQNDSTAPNPTTHARLGLGAADSFLHQGASALGDENGVGTTNVWATDTTTSAFVKSDNATGTIDAQAVAASFEVDGFTLDWTTNDVGTKTRMSYLALGDLGPVGVGCTPTGSNFVQYGTFNSATQTPAGNNFQTSAPWQGVNACPGDTGITIRTVGGNCGGTNDLITQFPGDPTWFPGPTFGATPNSLYTNGNNLYGADPNYQPYIYWRQTVTGLTANTTYTFYLYASNGNNPTVAWPSTYPSLRFCKGVTGTGPYGCATTLNAIDFEIANETPASGDVWRRYQVTFTTGPAETTADLAILDTANKSNGDDVQITALGVQACAAPTAVRLSSFTAVAGDGAVALSWETGTELDNLGFHLYRGLSPDGPWQRLTASLIPGLGSSLVGKAYSFLDSGLANGTTYFYRLEDVNNRGQATSHGPVSATPQAGAVVTPTEPPAPGPTPPSEPEPGSGGGTTPSAWVPHGDPSDVSLRLLGRTEHSITLELRTGGFYSLAQDDGSSRLFVPGFFDLAEPGWPTLPTRRTWTAAAIGAGARVGSVSASELLFFDGLVPPRAGAPQAVALRDGTLRAVSRRVKAAELRPGLYPGAEARVLQTAFQGDAKKAYLELAPLRFDAAARRLVLARRMVVTLVFDGVVRGESGTRSSGRRPRSPVVRSERVLARLATRTKGLHSVTWEEIFSSWQPPIATTAMRLSRQGSRVPFHVEPTSDRFGPGSTLFFLSEGAEVAYANDAVYELCAGRGGVHMGRASNPAFVPSEVTTALVASRRFEQNTNYIPGLLEATDLWMWAGFLGGSGVEETFTVTSLAPGPATLRVDLQGASDTDSPEDHHVRVSVGGVEVGQAHWDGMTPYSLTAEIPPGTLVEGDNTLRLDSDGALTSAVWLDRFVVDYPHALVADAGILEGKALASGIVEATGFSPGAVLLDLSAARAPRWLGRSEADHVRFLAEAGHRYLAVSPGAMLHPEVRPVAASTLKDAANQADWIVIAPQALMPAAEPLLLHRQAQGLAAKAVSLEEIADVFGFGEVSPDAVRDFVAFAFNRWARPSPRYVLLLGDASYDPKGYFPTAPRHDLLPSPLVKSSFLWTVSDPAYAMVNGEDLLPDLAVGRLTAGSLAEAEAAVQKVLAFETAGRRLDGKAVLVADDPDPDAGDFEANANDIASLITSRPVEEIFHSVYGTDTKAAVLDAFDSGASLVSYIGHGSQVLWANASENVFRAPDVDLLQPQPIQPLVLTMTCSNGYFVHPWANAISERLTLAPDKGAIAAFSPSGLSLDSAAHLYHRALVLELEKGTHARIGDLVLAAQQTYLDTGAFPELLSLYHLFGDPALKIQ